MLGALNSTFLSALDFILLGRLNASCARIQAPGVNAASSDENSNAAAARELLSRYMIYEGTHFVHIKWII